MRGSRGHKLILFFCCLLCCWASIMAQKKLADAPKIAPALLVQDLQTLHSILEHNHPSLYWYTPKDSMDMHFNVALHAVSDSMAAWKFKNVVATYLSNIKCGHTSVHYSTRLTKQYKAYRYPQFPFLLKVWKDSAVVLASLNTKDSVLKRGTIITAINQTPIKKVIDSIYATMSTDGNSINFKSQVLSNNFSGWYKSRFGDADTVSQLSFIDSIGNISTAAVPAYSPAKPIPDSAVVQNIKQPKPAPIKKWNLTIDSVTHTAFMRVTSFSGEGLRKFIRRSFKQIHTVGAKNLVIDLRENGGGNIKNSTLLTKYLIDHSFKIADSVVANNRGIGKVPTSSFFNVVYYALAKAVISKKEQDGKYHFKRFEKHYYEPITKDHFDGDIYVLQGGYTFSASTLFIAPIMEQKNVTLIGEETGGGYYGNSAMMIPNIKLPNSGLQCRLPLYRLVMDKTRPKGNGIMPDILVEPSSYAIKKGFDLKMETVKKIIAEKN